LHLGHLAKAFALREAPSAVTKKYSSGDKPAPTKGKSNARQAAKDKDGARKDRPAGKEREREHEWQETYDPETEARMSRAVREQGRLSKHKGKLVSSGASEFQVAGGDALEALVRAR
jgi:ATP-dependent RNA helicase DDX31/DBP7